jgi:hypothetical protein
VTKPERRPVDSGPDRPVAAPSASPSPVEPLWVGWVAALGPEGVERRKVRLPASIVNRYSVGEPYPADHRSTVAVQTQRDMVSDAFFEELSKAKGGR